MVHELLGYVMDENEGESRFQLASKRFKNNQKIFKLNSLANSSTSKPLILLRTPLCFYLKSWNLTHPLNHPHKHIFAVELCCASADNDGAKPGMQLSLRRYKVLCQLPSTKYSIELYKSYEAAVPFAASASWKEGKAIAKSMPCQQQNRLLVCRSELANSDKNSGKNSMHIL